MNRPYWFRRTAFIGTTGFQPVNYLGLSTGWKPVVPFFSQPIRQRNAAFAERKATIKTKKAQPGSAVLFCLS